MNIVIPDDEILEEDWDQSWWSNPQHRKITLVEKESLFLEEDCKWRYFELDFTIENDS